MTAVLLFLIKLIQVLMLLAALAAFGYGAYHLGDALWLRLAGAEVGGRVVDTEVRTETRQREGAIGTSDQYETVSLYYPVVLFSWPPGSGATRQVTSPLALEGRAAEAWGRGKRVTVRVDPARPDHARPVLPPSAYFWPAVGFAAGLAGLLLVGGLFFLHEGAFGRDLSAGLSLFRSVHLRHVVLTVTLVLAVVAAVQHYAPWLGRQELLALATGELHELPPLLKARGEPPPSQPLNAAEAAVARLPWLGLAYASTAFELAVSHGDQVDIDRFLDAYADPAIEFRIQSRRALADAMRHGRLETVQRMLALGFRADDPFFDPLGAAIERDRADLAQALLEAGASLDRHGGPDAYLQLALDRRADASLRWLIEHGAADAAEHTPPASEPLLDRALQRGMMRSVAALKARNAPSRLPAYAEAVLKGDVEGLRAALPETRWPRVRVGPLPLLHVAAEFGHVELTRALLAAGADANLRASSSEERAVTPLHLAVRGNHPAVVATLLAVPKLAIDRSDGRGMTALGYALASEHWAMVRALIEAGANPNQPIRSRDGETALHFAARRGDVEMTRFLLAHGADPRIGSFSGVLPSELAPAAVQALLEAAAPRPADRPQSSGSTR